MTRAFPVCRVLLISISLAFTAFLGCDQIPTDPGAPVKVGDSGGSGYQFCFWNVENLFDDQNNGLKGKGDKEYDVWLSSNPHMLRDKLDKLSQVILSLNGGRGPDILGMVEIENERAAQLLQKTLNDRLDPSLLYTTLLMKEVKVGRHIAPVLLTRLPAVKDRTRVLDKRYRILQSTLKVDGKELVVIVSHWTSRLGKDSDRQRAEYANKIYGACNAIYHADPAADVLICGDFNDSPDDLSVKEHLHACSLKQGLKGGPHLQLFDLMADKDARKGYGTYYYQDWSIFDHIVVSPGMFDGKGWSCNPDTLQTVNNLVQPGDRTHKPWRFGGEKQSGPRGYSDHFPVAVRLQVH